MGYWQASWRLLRLSSSQMVSEALKSVLEAHGGRDWGEYAGDTVMQLAEDRGLVEERHPNPYACVLHHACLSDIIASVLRKKDDPAWVKPDPVDGWESSAYLAPDGSHLRRVVLASHWSDERQFSERNAWGTLGEMAVYKLPVKLAVIIIGQEVNGLRSTPWTTGFLHPSGNQKLRFRKRSKTRNEVFSSKWFKIKREEHAEISRDKWLDEMLADDVLSEICFPVEIPLQPKRQLQRVQDIAKRKLHELYLTRMAPDPQLSTCDWPTPCVFRKLCRAVPEREPATMFGYQRLSEIRTSRD